MMKQRARAYYLQKRISLYEVEREKRTSQIFYHIQKMVQIPQHSCVLSYSPIHRKGEMDTKHINQYFREKFNATIAFPKIEKGNTFQAVLTKNGVSMIKKKNNLFPEPHEGKLLDPLDLALVITPLIHFDMKGNRIGYGKGMYDRFLKKISPSCLILGCSFFTPLEKIDDVSPFDQPLDIGICPDSSYSFTVKNKTC